MDNLAHVAMLSVRLSDGLPIEQVISGRTEVLGHLAGDLAGQPLALLCARSAADGRDAAALQARVRALAAGDSMRLLWPLQGKDGCLRQHELLLTRAPDNVDRVTICMVNLGGMAFAKALSAGENRIWSVIIGMASARIGTIGAASAHFGPRKVSTSGVAVAARPR